MADFNFDSLGDLLKNVGAPILGSVVKAALPGAGGELVDGLIKGLADNLGTSATPDAVGKAIEADPVVGGAAAKQVEAANAPAIADHFLAALKSQEHARDTTVALVREGSWLAAGPTIYSTAIVGGFLGTLFWFLTTPVPISDQAGAILTILLGVLTGQMTQVGNYFLGSSAGSASKDATIRNIATAQASPTVAASVGAVIGKAAAKAANK